MIDHADYPVTVHMTGNKEGVARSMESGLSPLPVASPPEFGGPAGVWSPEHLFVTSIAACFMTTFLAIAELSQLAVDDLEVAGVGTIEREERGRYRFTRVVLRPRIVLSRGANTERAERIVQKAEDACLITRSLWTEVSVEPVLELRDESPAAASG